MATNDGFWTWDTNNACWFILKSYKNRLNKLAYAFLVMQTTRMKFKINEFK